MLSAETAIGADPTLVVRTMARVAARAEAEADYAGWGGRLGRARVRFTEGPSETARAITAAMSHAAWQVAKDAGTTAVLCCTRSGTTARAMARFRPEAQLLGLSPSPRTLRQLALSWGVVPMSVDLYSSTDELVWFAVEAAVKGGMVKAGDLVAVLAGAPDRDLRASDVLRLVPVH
jgi:pyruvate kinase